MAQDYYLPPSDEGKAEFLTNFSLQLPLYATTLGLTALDLADVSNAAQLFEWALTGQQQYSVASQQWTAFKNRLRSGAVIAPIELPLDPVVPAPPALPNPGYGIFKWIGKLVQRIKNHPNYTEEMGENLGIIGPELTAEPDDDAPVLTTHRAAAGQPEIEWEKSSYTALEIEVDRGAGFVFLAMDTIPNYIDTHALPATPTKWTYRAIYRLKDARAGQWSNPVEITVGG